MKHSKKILVMLMTFGLCTVLAACGSSAGNAGGDAKQAESAASESKDEAESMAKEDSTADQTDDAAKTANIGIIAWSLGMGDESEFTGALQTALSEQYSEQIGDVIVMDAIMDTANLTEILENMIVLWEGKKAVILIVNGENGFSDEDLLSSIKEAEKAGMITGVDHVIDGAPESTFVFDASDAAGCASMIMENAFK